jgi:S-DNA-T family DNA segregation ATPase FtsK/SpoIIIE
MLFQAPDAPAPLRMQGCFVSDGELNKLINYWQSARRLASMRREMNVITAVSDAIPKTELDQAVWDVDEADPQSMVKRGRGKNAGLGTREVDMNTAVSPADEAYPTTPSQLAQSNPQPVLYPELEEEILAEQAKALANDHPVDELWEEAVALVRGLGKASASLLQRRFRIGYTRASRLIDHMEDAGIIGEATGTSKARMVFDADGQPLGRGGDDDEDEEEDSDMFDHAE